MENKLNKLAHLLVKKFSILPSKYYNELFFTDIYNKLVVIYNHCLRYNNDNFLDDEYKRGSYSEYCGELLFLITSPYDKKHLFNSLYGVANEIEHYTLAYLVTNFSELKIKCNIPDDYAEFIGK